MKRTTIFIEPGLERDLQAIARRQQRPMAALVREAVARYVAGEQHRGRVDAFGFVAVGRSGRGDTAERHEQLLWRDLEPHGDALPARALKRPPSTRVGSRPAERRTRGRRS